MIRQHAHAILNPVAGGNRGRARWEELVNALRQRGIEVDESRTERAGHASELAARGDYDLIIAVGGDGTVSEVAAGILQRDPIQPQPILGVLPVGSGNDFQRTARELVLGSDLATRFIESEPAKMDAGRIRFEGVDRRNQYFINAANVGFSAAVGERAERSFRSWPRMAGYFVSALVTLVSHSNVRVEMDIDGETVERRANSVVLALGKYFGQGMKVAPDAVTDDGKFDIILIGDIGRLELVAAYPRLYSGSHIHHGKVDVLHGARVSIRADRPLAVEGDGDVRGWLPATFEVLPGALRVIA